MMVPKLDAENVLENYTKTSIEIAIAALIETAPKKYHRIIASYTDVTLKEMTS